mmetsp:Transcript_12922/g.25267  ORF Transcript_12922/g.25267 Transcript_12922/m.25267 type:complete len:166 (-) Transcript_12922:1689-2186(-)
MIVSLDIEFYQYDKKERKRPRGNLDEHPFHVNEVKVCMPGLFALLACPFSTLDILQGRKEGLLESIATDSFVCVKALSFFLFPVFLLLLLTHAQTKFHSEVSFPPFLLQDTLEKERGRRKVSSINRSIESRESVSESVRGIPLWTLKKTWSRGTLTQGGRKRDCK